MGWSPQLGVHRLLGPPTVCFHIYQWLATARIHTVTQPSHPLKALSTSMLVILDSPPQPYPTIFRRADVWAASDAAAYPATVAKLPCVGGWWSTGAPSKHTVHWFSIQIPASQLWAFKDGSSQKRTAAIELMATLLLAKLMMQEGMTGRGTLATPLVTDNAGNSLGVSKERFKKWPAADILMELVLTSYFAEAHFTLSHVKRDSNEWADQLSKGDTGDFSPALRRHWSWDDDTMWHVWPGLRDHGYVARDLVPHH